VVVRGVPPVSRIGPYRIERRLGSGGMGLVYLGHDDSTGGLAAVKLIRPEYAANPQLRARLRREVTAAQRVPRFCTAPVLAFDVDADPPWVATEYIDAPTLDAALLERGPLTGPALETFAVGVAVALQAIHQHGVVHRDLKPSNILLSPVGPRVIDFGIARIEGSHTPITRAGTVVGTPAYMAPEQLRGDPVTAAVDVFAWGSLVTYAATGRPPFGTGDSSLYAILHEEPGLGGLAGPLRALVTAALDKQPATRLTSADLVARLSVTMPAAATQVLTTAAAAQPAPRVRSYRSYRRRARGRRLMLAAAVGTALAVAGSATAVTLTRGDDGTSAAQARSRQLAAEAVQLVTVDPAQSMRQALAAWAAAPTTEARSALLTASTLPYAGQLGTEPGGVSVAVDPAGTMVAVGYPDGTVRLWDVATRRLLGEPLAAHGGDVFALEFSPDGTMLATASIEADPSAPEQVRVWEIPSGRLLHGLPGYATVAWLPDGTGLVATKLATDADGRVVTSLGVWDPRSGEELAAIPTGEVPVLKTAVSRDAEWVAGGRGDGTAEVWRLADGRSVAEISGHDAALVQVAFAASGELVTLGIEGSIRLWDVPDTTRPRVITEAGNPGPIVATSDGYLLAGGAATAVRWFDTATGEQGGEFVGYGGVPLALDASADGRLVAVTGPENPTVLWRRGTFWLPHPEAVMDVAFTRDGRRLATVAETGAVRIWNPATGSRTAAGWHDGEGYGAAFAPDGTLATTALDGTVRIVAPDGEQRAELRVADQYEARELVFAPDGSLLAVVAAPSQLGRSPTVVYVWDMRTLRPRHVLGLGGADTLALAFTRDGGRLLAAANPGPGSSDGPALTELRAWQTRGLAPVPPTPLGSEQVYDLAVSPDGETLAVTGPSRTVELRPLDRNGPARQLGSHPASVRQVVFSPDGRLLATITTEEPIVRLWDRASGALLATLTGHSDPLNGIAFSPDGRTLASGGPDGYVGLWAVEPSDAIRRLCQAVSHPLCTEPAPPD